MSNALIRLVTSCQFPPRPSERFVLFLLADATRQKHDTCWPSVSTLAKRSGLSRATVLRAIASLLKSGAVTIERKKGKPSRYKIEPAAFMADRRVVSPCDHTGLTMTPHRSHHDTGVVSPCDRIHKEPEITGSAASPPAPDRGGAASRLPDRRQSDPIDYECRDRILKETIAMLHGTGATPEQRAWQEAARRAEWVKLTAGGKNGRHAERPS